MRADTMREKSVAQETIRNQRLQLSVSPVNVNGGRRHDGGALHLLSVRAAFKDSVAVQLGLG